MDDENGRYDFYFHVKTPYGQVIDLSLENCDVFESELELYLYSFERFLQACTFIMDGKHLELIDDEDTD